MWIESIFASTIWMRLKQSVEEREHAKLLMEYQNKRGGRVKLQPMVLPQSEFDHPEKGNDLYGSHAMEVAIKILQLLVSKLDGESMNIERFLELSFWW
ncbi:unnamed protein product [Arabidopsis lyrata]|uniref:Ferritin/DPS domain-containing protein n=1 Tax=Arabidopsis lyrata subsp. lyrata TaxID=81972 RepID=D7M258_ARALL|nr:hypothetical protein ARALYDRAFT_908912 [Arabidopsis lyrata subsp. lyrata]CAH8270589.1 unnamed protein product [Arabidopsis lyrata]